MDNDTLILMIMTFLAFCWYLKLRIDDNSRMVRKLARVEEERLARIERVKQLKKRPLPESWPVYRWISDLAHLVTPEGQ